MDKTKWIIFGLLGCTVTIFGCKSNPDKQVDNENQSQSVILDGATSNPAVGYATALQSDVKQSHKAADKYEDAAQSHAQQYQAVNDSNQ